MKAGWNDYERLAQTQDDTHQFRAGADDFKCAQCGKPRALHARDGFSPKPAAAQTVSMDPSVRYRNSRDNVLKI